MDLEAARGLLPPNSIDSQLFVVPAWPDLARWLRRRNAFRIKSVASKLINRNTRRSCKFERIDDPFDTPLLNPSIHRLAGHAAQLRNRGYSARKFNCRGHHIGFDASKALGTG